MLKCTKCKSTVYMTRDGICKPCLSIAKRLVKKLPDIRPIKPPLGYSLFGCDDMVAELEVMNAYNGTPDRKDKEN